MAPVFSSARLRGHRDGQNLEIHSMAVRLGMSDADYDDIESGRFRPGEEMTSRIARVLGIPVERLRSAPGTLYEEDYAAAVVPYMPPMTEEDIECAARALLGR